MPTPRSTATSAATRLRACLLRHVVMPVRDRRAVRCRAGPRADPQHDRGDRGAADHGGPARDDIRRECPGAAQIAGRNRGKAEGWITDMKTQNIKVKLRDGEMGAYLAIPDKTPAGAIIAIMEIWGVNDTMRQHAHEFAEAGFVCLVPDLFWRQEPGVELSDHNPDAREEGVRSLLRLRLRPRRARHGGHLALPGEAAGVQRQGRRGRLLSRRQALLPHVLPHRHRLRGRLLRHLYRAPHPRGARTCTGRSCCTWR